MCLVLQCSLSLDIIIASLYGMPSVHPCPFNNGGPHAVRHLLRKLVAQFAPVLAAVWFCVVCLCDTCVGATASGRSNGEVDCLRRAVIVLYGCLLEPFGRTAKMTGFYSRVRFSNQNMYRVVKGENNGGVISIQTRRVCGCWSLGFTLRKLVVRHYTANSHPEANSGNIWVILSCC